MLADAGNRTVRLVLPSVARDRRRKAPAHLRRLGERERARCVRRKKPAVCFVAFRRGKLYAPTAVRRGQFNLFLVNQAQSNFKTGGQSYIEIVAYAGQGDNVNFYGVV